MAVPIRVVMAASCWILTACAVEADVAPGDPTAAMAAIRVQAEDFTSYYDTSAGNTGGQYRATDVDIEVTTDSGGGHNVGWIAAGEWLEYAVTLGTTTTYRVDSRVAAITSQSLRVEVDGATVATLNVPATGAWQAWATIQSPTVTLAAGTHRIRFRAVTGSWNLNYFELVPAGTSPYGGVARSVPGRVEAEDFDVGANGTAYSDSGAGNNGGAYRATDVDLEATTDTGGGHNVGWIASGEWLLYTVDATSAGTYRIDSRVAGRPGALRYEIDGVDVTGSIATPETGAWQAWTTVSSPPFALAAGAHTIRVRVVTGAFNLNWFALVAATSTGGRLEALSWNLHHADNVTAQAQRVIDRGNPHVLCAQELPPAAAEQLRAELSARSGATWYLRGSGTSDGTAILSRLPFVETEVRDLGGNSWGANRHGVRAEVSVGGLAVNVFCVHLDWPPDGDMTNHIENRTRLVTWLDSFSGRRLLGGDLNAWTWGPASWEGDEQRQTHALLGQRLTHVCASLRGSHDACNADWTNNGWLPDHFYRSTGLASVSYSIVDHGGLSDHKMQFVEVDAN